MKRILQTIENHWFSPVVPERLAILRIATGCFSLWYLIARFDMLQRLGRSEASLYEPVGLAKLLSTPMSPDLFNMLLWLTIGLNIAYIIGWKFRWTGPAFAVTLLFFMCYRNSWSMIYHNYNALIIHVFIIGFVAAADAISIDAWVSKGSHWRAKMGANWRYGWAIKLISAGTIATYVLSGLAKIFGDLAWAWVSGSAMRSQVAVDALRKEMLGGTANPLFEWLYPHTEIFLVMGIGTMILELAAPLALFHKKIGVIWALLACSMHWGIYFIMGIDFPYHMSGFVFLSFFAVEKIWYKLQDLSTKLTFMNANKTPTESAIILFDGVCNFCNTTVRFIINRDPHRHFRFASLQSEIGKQLLQKHDLSADLSTIVLIENNKVSLRSSAVLHIAKKMTFPWNILCFFIIIPKPLRDICYNKIARRRYQWFGVKETCEIPTLTVMSRFL